MLYQITGDSISYIEWTSSMPPVYCLFLKLCGIFGPLKLDIAVILQIALCLFSGFKFTKWLNLKSSKWLAFAIAISPIVMWGLKIGNDLMSYSIMLLAISDFHNNKKRFFILALLATLTRWQYCYLFGLFLFDKKSIKYFLISLLFIFAIGFKCGLNPISRFSIPLNYIYYEYDIKPEKISHAAWFNKHLDDLGGEVKTEYFDTKKFIIVIKDKIRDNFRFHQLFIFPLLLLLGSPMVRFLVLGAMLHYFEIFLLTSPYFHRYTFMVELILILAMLKFYDLYRGNK